MKQVLRPVVHSADVDRDSLAVSWTDGVHQEFDLATLREFPQDGILPRAAGVADALIDREDLGLDLVELGTHNGIESLQMPAWDNEADEHQYRQGRDLAVDVLRALEHGGYEVKIAKKDAPFTMQEFSHHWKPVNKGG